MLNLQIVKELLAAVTLLLSLLNQKAALTGEKVVIPPEINSLIQTLSTYQNNTPVPANSQTQSTTTPTNLPIQTTPLTIEDKVKSASVNIFCAVVPGSPISSLTGSGVIISPRGVVLTNAHVGQYFLLKDFPSPNSVDCTIRMGSPARSMYKAKLLYLPEAWVNEYRDNLIQKNPRGTGENDFALLIIDRAFSGESLPKEFPYLNFSTSDRIMLPGSKVVSSAYPAGNLLGIDIINNLLFKSSNDIVSESYGFKSNTENDLIAMNDSNISARGSSGGPVVTEGGELGAIVVTASSLNGIGEIRAITVAHINRRLSQFVGSNLQSLLSGDLAIKSWQFEKTILPTLVQKLISSF